MSFDIDNHYDSRALPSDITLRQPIYRRRGLVGLVKAALAVHRANGRLRVIARRFRSGAAPEIPDHLREDIGLPPLPPRLPNWWELKR